MPIHIRYINAHLLGLCLLAPAAGLNAATANAQQPPSADKTQVPDGDVEEISEWALAGIVWSEANLVHKLAVQTARQNELTDAERKALKTVAVQTDQLIERMESFGWQRMQRKQKQAAVSAEPSDGQSAVPDPDAVGAKLAQKLGGTEKPDPEKYAEARKVPAGELIDPEVRIDTETPLATNDPGLDDERMPDRLNIDVDQYRVDDFVDETPAEARNRADAVEDGVERAIAAADDDGISGPVAGRISEREVMTRSNTMAYSIDSIYDRDDYDPNIDYDVEKPLTPLEVRTEASDIPDPDDDVSTRRPAIAATGEDELIAAARRGGTFDPAYEDVDGNETEPATAAAPRPTLMSNFTAAESIATADANWVQLHLDLNQQRWFAAKRAGLTVDRVLDARDSLTATIRSVYQASSSEKLQALLVE